MVKVPKGYRSANVRDTRSTGNSRSPYRPSSRSRGGSDLLGSMIGGNATGGSLLGSLGGPIVMGILRSMMGGGRGGGGGLGGLLGSMLGGGDGDSAPRLTNEQLDEADDQATILIRAMINAAKADGKIDRAEIDAITSRLGDIDENEKMFLRDEFRQPLDVATFARTVPAEMAQEVYAFSLVGIKVDTNKEAQYLRSLASRLNLTDDIVDQIHRKFDEPDITG